MILCKFDFPFVSKIALPAGEAYYYTKNGRDLMITSWPLYGVTTVSYSGDRDSWDVENLATARSHEVNKFGDKKLSRTIYFSEEDGCIYKSGYEEPTNFTRITVVLELDSREELDSEESFNQLQEWVSEVFIDLYMHTSYLVWIVILKSLEWQRFQ